MSDIYDSFRAACARKGTNITNVLKAIGRPTGSTGTWKHGRSPHLDVVIEIANYLGVSLDELVFGTDNAKSLFLDDNYSEWYSIISKIPAEKQEMCKDFLRTHAVMPEKFLDQKSVS